MRLPLLLGLILSLLACTPAPQPVVRISGPTMGTSYHIAWAGSEHDREALQQQVDARLVAINRSMSTYDPESELSRLNRGLLPAGADGWVRLSADLTEVLALALQVWRDSGGAFDVTIGPLVNAWGFGPQARPEHIPDAGFIRTTLAAIGSDAIRLDAGQQRLQLQKPLYIDLSAIAKGWAVDEIAAILEQHGISGYMVEIGGEIRTAGSKPDGQPWRIAIERPPLQDDGREVALVITPANTGLATSGNYRNYFEEEGVRYSHTIDPASGYPVQHNLASVSVLHESTALADAWATAFSVLGAERSLQLAEQHRLAVFLLTKEPAGFVQRTSTRFNALFPLAAETQEN